MVSPISLYHGPLVGELLIWINKERNMILELSNHKRYFKKLIPALQKALSPSASEIIEDTPSCLGDKPSTGLNSSIHFELGTVPQWMSLETYCPLKT